MLNKERRAEERRGEQSRAEERREEERRAEQKPGQKPTAAESRAEESGGVHSMAEGRAEHCIAKQGRGQSRASIFSPPLSSLCILTGRWVVVCWDFSFLGFLVTMFQSFKDPKIQKHYVFCWKILIQYYHICFSSFLGVFPPYPRFSRVS